MKLMGIGKLHALAFHADRTLAGAASALLAEMKAARWSDSGDAAKAFPNAEIDHARIIIPLPAENWAMLRVSYPAGIILIESAGPLVTRHRQPTKTLRKKA